MNKTQNKKISRSYIIKKIAYENEKRMKSRKRFENIKTFFSMGYIYSMVFSGIITFSYLIAILFGYELNLCNGIDEFGLHFLLVCYALTFVFGWILAGCLVKMKR